MTLLLSTILPVNDVVLDIFIDGSGSKQMLRSLTNNVHYDVSFESDVSQDFELVKSIAIWNQTALLRLTFGRNSGFRDAIVSAVGM